MNISELIKLLEAIKESDGDLEVRATGEYSDGFDADEFVVIPEHVDWDGTHWDKHLGIKTG